MPVYKYIPFLFFFLLLISNILPFCQLKLAIKTNMRNDTIKQYFKGKISLVIPEKEPHSINSFGVHDAIAIVG